MDLALPAGFRPLAFWHKLNMVEQLARSGAYDWVWWIDFDTVITNSSVRLETLIADGLAAAPHAADVDMIVTADWCAPPPPPGVRARAG